jgi:peptidoglycan/LPS O-acetylase OafA/YrhL
MAAGSFPEGGRETVAGPSVRDAGWLAPIDGLRGISILMVLTAHVYRPGWERIQGRMGVTVFFVLSGFLITRLMLREERDRGSVGLRAFYIRRAFRLFPLYYFVLGIYCVLLLVLRTRPDLRQGFSSALPYYLFYLQEIPYFTASQPSPFYQSWSLGIEEKFYLVWPILAFWLSGRSRSRLALAASAAVVLSAAHFSDHGRYLFPYASICVGCAAALLHDRAPVRELAHRYLSGVGAWMAGALLVTAQIGVALGHRPVWDLALVGYPLFVAAFMVGALESQALGRMLSGPALVELGRLSYGIYLVHLLVRNTVEAVLARLPGGLASSGVLIYAATLAGSVVVARALASWLEAPLRQLGRRIAEGRPYESPQVEVANP